MTHHICDSCGKEVPSSSSLYYISIRDVEHGSELFSTKEKSRVCRECAKEILDSYSDKTADPFEAAKRLEQAR